MNVLVSGASNGIGFAVATYLANKGITVYACDIIEKKFESNNIIFNKLDVTDIDAIKDLHNKLKNDNVVLDSIINIAGVFLIDSFIEVNDAELKKIFDVNLFGTINLNKYLYPLLSRNGRIIITTSEVAPLDPMPFNGIYNVTKTALDSYAQALRQELNLNGQKVVTIRPGAFNTALSMGALVKTEELTNKTQLYKKQSVKFYNLVKMFMGKPWPPEKLAKTYYKALIKRKPKVIYRKHTNLGLKLLNVLPKRMQCGIIKLILKTK